MVARLPDCEIDRLAALYEHRILDTLPDEGFDDLVRLAALDCGVPMAAVSLIDEHRQWFKASIGFSARETPRDIAFCAHTILEPDCLIIQDAQADLRFADNPQVTGGPCIRFYAGVPLVTEEGYALGSLCVIDEVPRSLTVAQDSVLHLLARQASKLLQMARHMAERERLVQEKEKLIAERETAEAALTETHVALRAVLEGAPVILYAADANGTITRSEGKGLTALGLKPGEAIGRSVFEFSAGNTVMDENTRRALAGEAVSYDAQTYGLSLRTELRPVRDSAGAVTGIIGVCIDVTERALFEERFRVLFEQSPHPHLLFDEEDGIIDCNMAALALMRCADKAQLLGRHPEHLSPEFQPDGRRSDEKAAEMCVLAWCNGSHRFEWQRRKSDGSECSLEVTLTPVTLNGKHVLLSVWNDLTESKRLEKANGELEKLAVTDGLTNLRNHRAFQERLAEEVSRATRYETPLSVILLDVDHFKQYNDRFGHPAGDAVLRTVANILQDCARDTDLVARYGGEEFVLILPQTDIKGAKAFAERLRVLMESYAWPLRTVTASFGVASLQHGHESGTELIVRADRALYQSKAKGRNQVRCVTVTKSQTFIKSF